MSVSVALVIQHAKRMTSLAPHVLTLPHKERGFRKEVFKHKMCVLISYITLSDTFLILRSF
jgi:hypothetical protein